MNDIRFRLLSVLILSVTAFTGIIPSLFVFVWWILFGAKSVFKKFSWKTIAFALLFAAGFPSAVLFFTGGDAFYGVKIAVIVLIAFWFGSECRTNDFMNLFVWLFGNRFGFTLGLSAEFSMTALEYIKDDFTHIRGALKIKGKKLGVKTVAETAFSMLVLSIRQAETSSLILARRGYVFGGTFEPSFSPKISDCFGALSAIAVLLIQIFLSKGFGFFEIL